MTCQYCKEPLTDAGKDTCVACNALIQEANCSGIYLIDAAVSISKQDDLATPKAKRDALKATFKQYAGS